MQLPKVISATLCAGGAGASIIALAVSFVAAPLLVGESASALFVQARAPYFLD